MIFVNCTVGLDLLPGPRSKPYGGTRIINDAEHIKANTEAKRRRRLLTRPTPLARAGDGKEDVPRCAACGAVLPADEAGDWLCTPCADYFDENAD